MTTTPSTGRTHAGSDADAILVTLFAGYGVTVTLAATVAVLLRAVTTVPQALAGLAAYAMVQKGSAEAEFEVQ